MKPRLNAVIGQVVSDFGATASSALMVLGDKLGLYRAMDGAGPTTSEELAKRTSTTERYVRDWLVNQAAGGFIDYDPQTQRYTLPPESALALARENNPYFVVGGFELFLLYDPVGAGNSGGFQDRRRPRVGPPCAWALRRNRALLPARVHGQSRRQLASRPGRGDAQAAGRGEGR